MRVPLLVLQEIQYYCCSCTDIYWSCWFLGRKKVKVLPSISWNLWQSYYVQQETGVRPKCSAGVQGGDNLVYSLQNIATKRKMSFKCSLNNRRQRMKEIRLLSCQCDLFLSYLSSVVLNYLSGILLEFLSVSSRMQKMWLMYCRSWLSSRKNASGWHQKVLGFVFQT